MAAYIRFYKKGVPKNKQQDTKQMFDEVDKGICELLGHEQDPTKWCALTKERVEGVDWYNIVGLCLACGQTPESIRKIVREGEHADNEVNTNIIKVCDYIEKNYDIECWRGF